MCTPPPPPRKTGGWRGGEEVHIEQALENMEAYFNKCNQVAQTRGRCETCDMRRTREHVVCIKCGFVEENQLLVDAFTDGDYRIRSGLSRNITHSFAGVKISHKITSILGKLCKADRAVQTIKATGTDAMQSYLSRLQTSRVLMLDDAVVAANYMKSHTPPNEAPLEAGELTEKRIAWAARVIAQFLVTLKKQFQVRSVDLPALVSACAVLLSEGRSSESGKVKIPSVEWMRNLLPPRKAIGKSLRVRLKTITRAQRDIVHFFSKNPHMYMLPPHESVHS